MRSRIAGLVLLTAGLAATPAAAAAPELAPTRRSMLITPAELNRQLRDPKLVLLHVGSEKDYQAAHIAGARYISFRHIEKAGDPLALQLPEPAVLDSVLGDFGIGADSRIVIYFGTDWVSPATRVWFTLDYLGLGDRTALLDGGLPAWRAAGLPVTTEIPPAATPGRRLASRAHPEVLATAEWIRDRLENPRVAILDARAPEFYRGLEAGSFPRPGHIPGARNLYYGSVADSANRFLPDSALRRLFAAAGYRPGQEIAVYCHIGQQATAVYFAARLLGYRVRLSDGSFQEWSGRTDLPVDRGVPSTEGALLSTDELATLLKQEQVTVIDARSDLTAYLANHIPGAPYLHFETLRASGGGVPGDTLSPEAYAGLLGRLGVRRDRPVVIYGTGDAANFNATFLAWILAGFRHPRVYLLDGGFAKWAGEGRTVTRKYPEVTPQRYDPDPYALEVAGVDWVRFMVNRPTAVIVDVRPADQYAGTAGPQLRRGHLPGAIHHFWQDDLRDAGNGVKVWKTRDELKATYERQGVTPDKEVFIYCNTGTEASHAWFALRMLLGYPRVRIYVPSFTDWAAREDLPVEQGAPRAMGASR